MQRIVLLSDTHNYLDPAVLKYFENCDQIWHAGDIGTSEITEQLKTIKPLVAVYGNIDGTELRSEFPKEQLFYCEEVKVYMTHIAGYPGKYKPEVKKNIQLHLPNLVICGHSHILKVMYDKQLEHLHMNPGAIGVHGFHHVKTMLRFNIDGKKIQDLEVIELGPRA